MSDAADTAKNEDVMSSVRRMVSVDEIEMESAEPEAEKLVLTASLRIDDDPEEGPDDSPDDDPPQTDAQTDDIPAEAADGVAEADHADPGELSGSSDVDAAPVEWQDTEPDDDDAPDASAETPESGLDGDSSEDSGDAILSSDASLDEAAVRDLVARIVREELQGNLGEKITRNVRKLVRREIHRAMSSQDLE